MNSSEVGEEKKIDNSSIGQNGATKDEGSTLPTFINNWAPLPSAASATSNLNIGSTLNLNLPNFYQGSGGSVISGPPLLGGVMLSNGVPSSNNSNITINSNSSRPEYLNISGHGVNNTSGLSVGQVPLTGSTANSTDGGQRAHSNSFNGYGFSQHAYPAGHSAPGMSGTGGTLVPTSGLVSNHIDFMNINSSPPLLSSASAASSGMFLTSMPGKGGDNVGMINHPNIYASMHNILPAGSASYTNLAAFREGGHDSLNSSQAVGGKRPPPTNAPNSNTSVNTNPSGPNKRTKAVANRGRAASCSTTAEVALAAGSTLPQTSPAATGASATNTHTMTSVPAFDSSASMSYNAAATATTAHPTAPAQVPPRPLPAHGAASAIPTSATITYPIITSYKATSVMTTGGTAYMNPANASSLHPVQGVSSAQYNSNQAMGSNAGALSLDSRHAMGLNSSPHLAGSFLADGSPRGYSYAPLNTGNAVQMQKMQHQQMTQQHQQTGQNLVGYNGSTQGMAYMQQQPNAYHRQQPMMSNASTAAAQGQMYGPAGGAAQMPNYPLNPLSNQNNTNTMNGQNNMQNNLPNNMQAMQYNMQGNAQNNTQNNATQQIAASAANKAAPARARVRNKTPRPGKKALAAAAAQGGSADGDTASVAGDATNLPPAPPVTKPMTYKEKRAASSKKAMAAAAAAAAAEAERNGEPIVPGLVVPVDARRKDAKRDRDNSLVDGEAGRSEREKAEKEESTTALLKRREPIVHRIEEIEDSKFLGRKGSSFMPPVIASVPSLSGPGSKPDEEWDAPEGHPSAQARGLRDESRRPKTHWDYLLQEVQWMAVDFRQELRWKLAASKRTAEACASSSSRCVSSRSRAQSSPASAIEARAAARTLARRVTEFWLQLSSNVTSSGGQADELCKLLSNDYSSELFAAQEIEAVRPENINKLTDKILSLPSIIRSSGSGLSLDDAAPPVEKPKSAYFHSNTNAVANVGIAPIALLAHQHAALQQVHALNAEKFGAVLYGKSYIGKTTTGCELIKEWLVRQSKDFTPVVLVVAEGRCVFRWVTELRTQLVQRVEVWSASSVVDASTASEVIVVSSELLNTFLASTYFANVAARTDADLDGAESATVRYVLQGVLVDRRCVPSGPTASPRTNREPSDMLSVLTARLDRHLTQRCLVVEDTFVPGNLLGALSFLSPGTRLADWEAKYPTTSASSEEATENHQEQIVRNTLNQLLLNLSVAVKLPINADSVIAAQTRVEVVAPEMDTMQARLYNTVMSHLTRHPSICSGESTVKLAAALVLLQKVCFHAALVTHKGQGVLSSRYTGASSGVDLRTDDNQQRSELDSSEAQLASSASGLPARPSLTNMSDNRAPYDAYWANNERKPGMSGSQVPTEMIYNNSSFSRGSLVALCDSADALDQGSCKLQGLRRLLRRFAGLRVAVLIETEEECELVKKLLESLCIAHEVAFEPTSYEEMSGMNSSLQERRKGCSAESADRWIASQRAVDIFNSPLNDTCVLVCSKHVFQPPNAPPQQADAVVILSDDWTSTTEVRDCFRLRLLSAGPTGPPLTLVRVAAGGTIEERMARKGSSLLQLQGTPISQLWSGAKSPISLTSIPASLINGNAEATLLNYAPLLVLPAAPKALSNSISPTPGSETDSSRTGSDRSGSPMVLSSESDMSKRNNESSLRGKGKGFIVLGKQGSTTFVKDQGLQGLVSRGRSGVLPGLGSLSAADPLRQPDAHAWFQRLHRDTIDIIHQFHVRSCSIRISNIGDLVVCADANQSTETMHSVQNRTDDTVNEQVSADSLKGADDDTLDNKQIGALLRRVFDQFVLGQAATATFGASTSLSTRDLKNRLLRILEEQFAEKIRERRDSPQISTFDGIPLSLEPIATFGQLEVQRLISSGLGKSVEESALGHLLLPYHYDSLLPLDSNRIRAEVDASQHWPQSFFVFRDVLSESRRAGVSVEHVLFVNPLQTACRGESISSNAFQHNSFPLDAEISIKYLAEGARSAAGASRSSKSRRSRPSGSSSRRKDSVTSLTNPAESADNSGSAPALTDSGHESKVQTGNEATFEGFLSDLEPTGDTPQKAAAPTMQQKLVVASPVNSPNPTQETTALDSWHPTEDDIIICTQNAFSDTHFKRTENWLNRALEQSRRRRRTAAEARLRYTWLCTTGRTQQRLQDPLVVAQIEQLRFSVQQRVAAAAAASAATAAASITTQAGSPPPSPYLAGPDSSAQGPVGNDGSSELLTLATPTKGESNFNNSDSALF